MSKLLPGNMTHKGFKIMHVNVRSILKKLVLLEHLYSNSDILGCSETWLDDRIPDNLVKIDKMKIFRCDRKKGLTDYNIHIVGGGVCIFVAPKWIEFTERVPNFTKIDKDFEIVTVTIVRPNFKKLVIACVYRPPKGKIDECIKILTDLISTYQSLDFEIWILGDFNIDMLRRDDVNTVQIMRFAKKLGLNQLIHDITRPNIRGGSCIDLIFTDSNYVLESGVLDDLVSDHYSTFCIRKKKKEKKEMINRSIRDYRNSDKVDFGNLLMNDDWQIFDTLVEPDRQWEIIHGKTIEIFLPLGSLLRFIEKYVKRNYS